jgi:hypothetical protein
MFSQDKEVKRKRVNLGVAQKLELTEKLDGGVTIACVCEIYRVKKQTVSDICKNKKKLKEFALEYSVVVVPRLLLQLVVENI